MNSGCKIVCFFSVADDGDDNGPVYIEYPEEVLHLRVNAIARRVDRIEREFFASFTIRELEAELQQYEDEEEDFDVHSHHQSP